MSKIQELKKRYIHLYNSDGVEEVTLNKIEEILKLKLPNNFRQIASFYSGGLLGGISLFAVIHENISPNIVEETLRLRDAINLPLNFVVLSEPPESLIVMDTQNTPSVIWCDATDVVRLHDKSFITPPQTWNSYLDFFNNILEDEEDEQME